MFNYDYYIASIIVLVVLIAYYFTMSITRDMAAKCFGFFLILCFAACVTDVISGGICMICFPENVPLNYLVQAVSCSMLHLIPMVYFFYMMILAKKLEKFPRKAYFWAVFGFLEQILIYTTPWTGWVFTYSAEELYARGPLMWVLVAGAIFYLLCAIVEVFWVGRELESRFRFATFAFIIITVICLVIQMFNSYYVLLGAAAAVNCLIMQLTLFNPRLVNDAKKKEVEARREAEEANRAKSTFLANMSHEIRTPMNAICGMAEVLGKSRLKPVERDYVRTIQEASQSLLHIIDDVLDFSKIDADRMELVEEDYQFDELITSVEDIIAARLQDKKVRFEINMGENVPSTVYGDKMRIHQILINILGNAVKFTDSGKISLDIDFMRRDEGKLQIEFLVTDTGIGIKKGDMEKLFSRFSQINVRSSRKSEGSGLGLVLSRNLARMMGGDVTVTSEYGVGSCFKITIVQGEKTYFKDSEQGQELKKFRAYVFVEDMEERWYLSRILSRLGVSTIMLNSERQLHVLTDDAQKEREEEVLFYSYENGGLVNSLALRCKKVALIEYYTTGSRAAELENYLRSPLDIFKVGHALLDVSAEPALECGQEIFAKNVRVAVVDDNKVNVKVAVALLKKFHVVPEAFTSGVGILKALEMGRSYDIIFMDYMMPEMNGAEVTRRIRQMPGEYPRKAVIIALTANIVAGAEKVYREAGMDDWLFKPVRLEDMQQMLVKYLPPEKVVYRD